MCLWLGCSATLHAETRDLLGHALVSPLPLEEG